MNTCYVDHLAYALGDQSATVEETAMRGQTVSGAELLKEAGFNTHHICKKDTTAYELAKQAVAQLEPHLDEVGAIVYSTCIPHNANIGNEDEFRSSRDIKHLMNFAGSNLQADFGMPGAEVFGLNQQACTGMLGSIRLASMLLATEQQLNKVLCVTADRFPNGALYEQAYNLISDGAAACLVSRSPAGFRVITGFGITNGAMATASDDETIGSFFNYTQRVMSQTLQRANLSMNDIDWIVPQNTHAKGWQVLSSLLRFPYEKVFYPTLPQTGHVISADNVINLAALQKSGKLEPGQKIMLVMAGFGLNWQCLILEWSNSNG